MRLTHQNVPFTMVANAVLKRNDISFAVKGLFAYLFSKPEDWDFSAERIARIESKEERKTIQRLLRELETAKLLTRQRMPTGKMEYRITFAEPEPVNDTAPMFELGTAQKNGFIGKFVGYAPDKTFVITTKNIHKVLGDTMRKAGMDGMIPRVNDIIDLFEPLNPSHDRLFKNKTQREATERLISKHGEDKVRKMIAEAVKCFGKQYCPTITTPVELELKLGQLAAAVKRSKSTDNPTERERRAEVARAARDRRTAIMVGNA